jgi:murein DD-endopeptidase MepM/ murein hydrolase activator NlpD
MRFLVITVLLCAAVASADTVYRYQDEQGRWHFTDRKPTREHDTVVVATAAVEPPEPQLTYQEQADGSQQLIFVNPWLAPVQFEVHNKGEHFATWVVGPRAAEPVLHQGRPLNWQPDYEYHYRLGKPIPKGDAKPLQPPVPPKGKFRISQGFNGHYSHKEEPSRHAVDIVMQVGEGIHAARDGVVVNVKDDYHMGGTDKFFFDKANYVRVLHDDHTFAVYAHILLGSAQVKSGDRVKTGDLLAGAGTSGYSTGPHLHFVLQRNDGENIVSEPFQFLWGRGVLKPDAGQWLSREDSN